MEDANVPDSLRQAAAGDDPTAEIHQEVVRLRDAGNDNAQLLGWLNSLLVPVREADPDSATVEAILDMLDLVEGWYSPLKALFPTGASANL
jgi:hypothetical protein